MRSVATAMKFVIFFVETQMVVAIQTPNSKHSSSQQQIIKKKNPTINKRFITSIRVQAKPLLRIHYSTSSSENTCGSKQCW